MWTLEQGIDLVRSVQSYSRNHKYHVALGGGVVNKGFSDKDVDVYFLPCSNTKPDQKSSDKIKEMLELLWGASKPIMGPEYPGDDNYRHKVKFVFEGKRIDAFIV